MTCSIWCVLGWVKNTFTITGKYTNTLALKKTFRESCITLPEQWKINISATKMSALPCSLFFPYTEYRVSWNCGYFCVNRADALIWQLDNTILKVDIFFLAWCFLFYWRWCSQVRCSFWLKKWQDNCIFYYDVFICKFQIIWRVLFQRFLLCENVHQN